VEAQGKSPRPDLKKNGDIPDRWITYLRRDISTALATIPDTPR
jgi:hypothetical protein